MEVYIMSKQTKVELTKVLVVIETIIAFVITMLINQTSNYENNCIKEKQILD